MIKIYFFLFLLLFKWNLYSQSLTLEPSRNIFHHYGILINTDFNSIIKSPLILHNSFLKETHILFVFKENTKIPEMKGLNFVKRIHPYKYYLYSKNSHKQKIKQIIDSITIHKKTTVFNFSLLPRAYADSGNCMNNGVDGHIPQSVTPFSQYSGESKVTDKLLNCLSGLRDGAQNTVEDTADFLIDLFNDPVKVIQDNYQDVKDLINQIENFKETFENLKNSFHEFKDVFKDLDTDAKISIICSFIGSSTVELLKSALIPGSAGVLLKPFITYLSKFSKLSKMISLVRYNFSNAFPKEFLQKFAKGEISDEVINRIEKFADHGMDQLGTCVIHAASR